MGLKDRHWGKESFQWPELGGGGHMCLPNLKGKRSEVHVYTDSQAMDNGLVRWSETWQNKIRALETRKSG